jgi:cystathionine beta-lyase
MRTFLRERLPEIELIEPEGTYLVWMDFRKLGMTEEEREDLVVNKAKLWLDSGSMFGKDGEGFERINIACPRATLKKALEQLEAALKAVRNTK